MSSRMDVGSTIAAPSTTLIDEEADLGAGVQRPQAWEWGSWKVPEAVRKSPSQLEWPC